MSIETKISYLNDTKQLIKQAIINKGVNVASNDTFRSYASKIANIPSGEGTGSGYKLIYDNYSEGEHYAPPEKGIVSILPDNTNTSLLQNAFIFEWNDTIYVGGGQIASTLMGNNKIYKFDKTTLDYIGFFTLSIGGIILAKSNVYVYNNKCFIGNCSTIPVNSTAQTQKTTLTIIDLNTETVTNGGTIVQTSGRDFATIFTNNYCYTFNNEWTTTASLTSTYVINLDTPTTSSIVSINTNTSKSICYNGNNVYFIGGRTNAATPVYQTSVQKLDLSLRTFTNFVAMPIGMGYMKTLCNERYVYAFGGTGATYANENIVYKWDVQTGQIETIQLDYYISEPLSGNYNGGIARFADNLYVKAYPIQAIATPNISIAFNTNNDNWYDKRSGIEYFPFNVGRREYFNGYGTIGQMYVSEDKILYTTSNGSGGLNSQNGNGCLFMKLDMNKYITVATPEGAIVGFDNGDEVIPTTPTIDVKSPFTGYVRYS